MAGRSTNKKQTTISAGSGTKRRKKSSGTASSTKKSTASVKTAGNRNQDSSRDGGIPMANEIQMILSIGLMLILILSNFGLCGYLGKALSSFFFGIFGCVQYVMPVAFCLGVFILIANDYSVLSIKKCSAGFVTLLMISAFAQVIYQGDPVKSSELFSQAIEDHHAGGILGGGIGMMLKNGFGTAGALVIVFCIMLLSLIMLTQRSFVGFFQNNVNRGSRFIDKIKENRQITRELRREEKERRNREETDLLEQEEKNGRMSSFLKMKSGNNDKGSPDSTDRVKQVEEKLKKIQESRSRKQKKSAQAAKERLRQEPEIHRNVPVFTSSEDVLKKDDVLELHPQVYPFTAEDGKTKPFEGELDFSAFSFSSGKQADEFAEDLSRNSKELKTFLSSLEEYTPAYREKNISNLSELKISEIDELPDSDDGNTTLQTDSPDHQSESQTEGHHEIYLADAGTIAEPEPVCDLPSDEEEELDSFHIVDIPEPDEETDAVNIIATEAEPKAEPKAETEAETKTENNTSSSADTLSADSIKINRAATPKSVSDRKPAGKKDYIFPPMNLLTAENQTYSDDYDKELKDTALKLQTTLESFGVHVTITDISCGPTVTRYEMFPEQGTKVSKIVSLTDDIKLNLAAADIRIEAPIPGKAAIGIEVPNKATTTVHLRELIDNRLFRNFKSRLAFAVGKDIGGKIVVADLAKMPHLLIAGATGSGKSVCINTLIMSLLYKATPDEVKLIMIDPKMVELSVYNGIPHLLIPVVTDPKKASGALNWAVAEMTDRYKKFAETNVRNLEGYNKKVDSLIARGDVDEDKLKKMPQIVIIIDELADLMMVAPGEVEDAIVRLSQLARAAGIHLVIATQRPSVNVITGLIKANVPSRIAFSVSSGVDSRTIIDMNGAEKLLGKGDMLFYPSGYQKPVRVQGALVDDSEVAEVVEFIKSNEDVAVYDDQVSSTIEKKIMSSSGGSQDRDEYFEAAARFIMEKEKATIGMLQRMFKIGFNRAARIMDQLADAGIVGPEEGTKPRQILMSPEQLEEYFEEYL